MRDRWLLLGSLLLGTPLWLALWLGGYAVLPGPGSAQEVRRVVIPAGTGLRGISRLLAEAGVIRPDVRFAVLARLRGQAGRLQAGVYRLSAGLAPVEVLAALVRGGTARQPVTIPEGLTAAAVADLLAGAGLADRERFLELTGSDTLAQELGIAATHLEGYLFPDSYALVPGMDEETIVRLMVNRFASVYQDLAHRYPGAALDRHGVVTLASIVEKETGRAQERPLVAAVFLNRLRLDMPLQADPTVIYGLERFDGNLTRQHLASDSPYNTYVHRGLPPGPIANPGRAALEAVLAPAAVPYLYFVAKNDGSHQFSTDFAAHSQAVRRYQGDSRRP
ncbi:MAG: endolytic transglycosylase MltG [Thermodesulfobacteriota bacterium]